MVGEAPNSNAALVLKATTTVKPGHGDERDRKPRSKKTAPARMAAPKQKAPAKKK